MDGDKLLDEIAEHYQAANKKDIHDIPLQGAKGDNIFDPIIMAQIFGVTKRMAEAILRLYAGQMKTLQDGGWIELPKIGKIWRINGTFNFEAVKDGS